MKKLDDKTIKKVKELRAKLDKNGKQMSLKRIKKATKLPMRQITYILYEQGNYRVMELVKQRVRDGRKIRQIERINS